MEKSFYSLFSLLINNLRLLSYTRALRLLRRIPCKEAAQPVASTVGDGAEPEKARRGRCDDDGKGEF